MVSVFLIVLCVLGLTLLIGFHGSIWWAYILFIAGLLGLLIWLMTRGKTSGDQKEDGLGKP